jgi:hypothetical protein
MDAAITPDEKCVPALSDSPGQVQPAGKWTGRMQGVVLIN